MSRLLGQLLQIRPGEWRPTIAALVFAFTALFTAVFSRTVADAVFLPNFEARWVPVYIAVGALGSVIFSAFYLGVVRRGRSGTRINALVLLVLAVAAIAGSVTGMAGGVVSTWVYAVTIVLVGPAANTVAWNVLTSIFHSRQSKRILPLVGAAGTVGAVAAGLMVRPLLAAVDSINGLIFPSGLVFLALVPLPHIASRFAPEEGSPPPTRSFVKNLKDGVHAIRSTPLVASLAGIMFLLSVATNFVDVLFLTVVKEGNAPEDIGIFLGTFHAVTNGAVLILQTFVMGRLFNRFGLRWVFLLYPMLLLFGGGLVAALPLFGVIAGYRGMDKILKFTGHYGGMDLLMAAVRDDIRDRARAFLRGTCVPAGALVAGAVAATFAATSSPLTTRLAVVSGIAIVSTISLLLAIRIRRQYLDELRQGLRLRVVRPYATPNLKVGLEGDVARLLTEATATGDAYLSRVSLDILAENLQTPSDLARLLQRPEPDIRKVAMEAVATNPGRALARTIRRHLEQEKDTTVLTAGLHALGLCRGDAGEKTAQRFLNHEDPNVRAEALLLMAQSSGAAGLRAALQAAEVLAKGGDRDRLAAARLVEGLVRSSADPSVGTLLQTLLEDEDPEVQHLAVRAAGMRRDEGTIRALIKLLGTRRPRAIAEASLAEVGTGAVIPLQDAALDEEEDRALRFAAVETLSRMRSSEAAKAVAAILAVNDPTMRIQAAAGLRTLRRHLGKDIVPWDQVIGAMRSEIGSGYRAAGLHQERMQQGLPVGPLLADGILSRIDNTTEALFGLAGALYGADWVDQAHSRYRSGSVRTQADAVEVLDLLIKDPESREMLTFLDQAGIREKARAARTYLKLLPGENFTGTVLVGTDRHLAHCLVHVGLPEGVHALPKLEEEVKAMGELFERVLLLKSVPLFSELAGEDLLPVAEVAKEVVVEPEAVIVKQGDDGDELFVVIRGRCSVWKEGVDEAITEIVEREAFGELALLDREPRAATVIADERTEMLRIGRQEFNDLMDAHPALTRGILKVLLTYVRTGQKPQQEAAAEASA